MIRILIAHVLLLLSFPLSAQQKYELRGKVVDSESKEPLPLATVSIYVPGDSSLNTFTVTRNEGTFVLKDCPKGKMVYLLISYMGYETYRKRFVSGVVADLGIVYLEKWQTYLREVAVEAEKPPVVFRGDTIEFSAKYFKSQHHNTLKDLLRRLPGLEIDQNGNITANGKKITRIMVEGKEYFGGNILLALNSLPADIIDKIQVVDTKSRQEAKRKVEKDGEDRTINLVLKKEKRKSRFGDIGAGLGSERRYEASGKMNIFDIPRQITILGASTNTNRPGNILGDIAPLSGSAGGVLTTTTAGLNYVDEWSKQAKINSSYTFASTSLPVESERSRHRLIDDALINSKSRAQTDRKNHRINFGSDIELDSLTDIDFKVLADLGHSTFESSVREKATTQNSGLIYENERKERTINKDQNITLFLDGSRMLNSRGRNLEIKLTGSRSIHSEVTSNLANTRFEDSSSAIDQEVNLRQVKDNFTVKLIFNEPLSSAAKLTFTYVMDINSGTSSRLTYNRHTGTNGFMELDSTYSNRTTSMSRNHQPQISLSYNSKDKRIRANLSGILMFNTLRNFSIFNQESVQVNQVNFSPNSRIIYQFKNKGNLSLLYNGNLRQPGIELLQTLKDNSDPANVLLGNPDLRPSFAHTMRLTYDQFSPKGFGVNAAIEYDPVSNRFATETRILANGTQETKTININGTFVFNTRFSLMAKVQRGSSVWTVKGGVVFNQARNINFTRNESLNTFPVRNVTDNIVLTPSADVSFTQNENLELRFNYLPGFNKMRFISPAGISTYRFFRHQALFDATMRVLPRTVLWNVLIHNLNNVSNSSFNQRSLIWNAALSYDLLRSGQLMAKISLYDLLRQNNSLTRTQSDYFIEDYRTNVLEQYFLASLSYKFKKGKPR